MNTLFFCMVAGSNAASLQLPIYAHHNHDAYSSTIEEKFLGRPIKSFQNLFYKANVSIGKPPQTFELALDTMTSDVFVPSVNCDDPCFEPRNNTYNSSLSSSYVKDGTSTYSEWAGVNYAGLLSSDTIQLGEIDVAHYLFEEWTQATCVSIGCLSLGYDGVLGLAPPWDQKGQIRRNVLSTLLQQDALDEPIFSLRLPIGLHDEGKMVFGEMDPGINRSSLINLPVVNVPDTPFFESWTVSASKVSFASPHPLNYTLPSDGFAILNSAAPYIILPSALANNLTAAIGARRGPAWFHHIPCERRQELPALTITLGGHEFSISAFEYTLEIDPPQIGRTCITTFMGADEFAIPRGDYIMLGHPFLRGFQSVWNFKARTVGLASLDSL